MTFKQFLKRNVRAVGSGILGGFCVYGMYIYFGIVKEINKNQESES